MTEGRHYWEVQLTTSDEDSMVLFGAVRPGQDCDNTQLVEPSSTSLFTVMSNPNNDSVNLFGNGKSDDVDRPDCDGDVSHVDRGEEYIFNQGDRIGCMLDLDAGWLRFFRNDKRLKQEFTSGVTGPLLRCAELYSEGGVVTALPGAEMPADAGL
jgi:hypothetical protein